MTRPRLTYFDFSGNRGEEIRLTFRIAGVDFEDVRVPGNEWPALRPTSPTGSMPFLEIDGVTLTHTDAILRLLGRRHGLHPEDDLRAAQHEGIMGYVEDLRHRISPTLRMPEEQKKAARTALATDYLPLWGEKLEAKLTALGDGPFVDGDRIHVADLKVYMTARWLRSGMLDHVPADVFDRFPRILQVQEAVAAHPAVAKG